MPPEGYKRFSVLLDQETYDKMVRLIGTGYALRQHFVRRVLTTAINFLDTNPGQECREAIVEDLKQSRGVLF